jgi:general secretion pathway protein I
MRSPRGFTLLEVLIALMVFALAAVVLGAAYVNVLHAYDVVNRGNSHDEDLQFARSLLLGEPDRKKASDGGNFQSPTGAQVRWHATIEPSAEADLFQVTFVCEIAETGTAPQRPATTENFMLLRPTWSEGLDMTQLRQNAKDRIMKLHQKLP